MTDNIWGNVLIEIGLFTFLGMLYYFYQKRKILSYEKDKGPLIMGYIIQACLTIKEDHPDEKLDVILEAIDDYLHNKTPTPPIALLKAYAAQDSCPQDLKDIITEGLSELEGK